MNLNLGHPAMGRNRQALTPPAATLWLGHVVQAPTEEQEAA